jgi:peptidoglycan hydrolase-like protein with peptidoglycan-binding domain
VSPTPAVFDADFVRAIARFQAMQGITQDGKLGPTTATRLSRETRAEARALGRTEGRELRQETYRLNRRSMTITITTAARELTNTGSAEFGVRWAVPDPRANGWVIQHVTFAGNKENCAGVAQALNNAPTEYWEGWQVRAGRVFIGSSADAHVADTFATADEGGGTRGTVRITGRVTFIPDFDLREPPWGHTVPEALALPTLTVAPPGWSDGFANLHELVVRWDDCVAPATHSVASTPR